MRASWIPGVSTKMTCQSANVRIPRIRSRVVCGFGVAMAMCSPTSRFRSVDFPTFGRDGSQAAVTFAGLFPLASAERGPLGHALANPALFGRSQAVVGRGQRQPPALALFVHAAPLLLEWREDLALARRQCRPVALRRLERGRDQRQREAQAQECASSASQVLNPGSR